MLCRNPKNGRYLNGNGKTEKAKDSRDIFEVRENPGRAAVRYVLKAGKYEYRFGNDRIFSGSAGGCGAGSNGAGFRAARCVCDSRF